MAAKSKQERAQPPDISDLVVQIIERLGLDPDDVRVLTVDSTDPYVSVTLYQRDAEGAKYLDENGQAALRVTAVAAAVNGGTAYIWTQLDRPRSRFTSEVENGR
jgi:hypothetical protein